MHLQRWVPVLFLVAALAAAPATAATAAIRVKSTVTITSGEGTEFSGTVTSAKKRCRVGRTVKLFREGESGSANATQSSALLVGTAKTDKKGEWMMDGSFLAGFYYARVLPLLVHVNGMAIRCAGDYSPHRHY